MSHNPLRMTMVMLLLRMSALVVVSGGYGDAMGQRAVTSTVMSAVRYIF